MPNLDLHKYEKIMEIRNMKLEDIDEIIVLQSSCFPGMVPWKREQLESHLEIFPEGQFVAEYDGKVIGSCSSLIINFDEYDDRHTWDDVTDNGYITNHNPDGYNLYGIEVMVHPNFRRMKIGQRLYDSRKELVAQLNLKSIIIGGRIPNYHKHADELLPREYVKEVQLHKIYDPVLSFQLLNGFTLMRINPNYLPDDLQSNKYATLMEWNNVDYQPKSKRYYKTSEPVRICVVQYMLRKIDSFDDFANQVEYFTDVASDANADFAVFPELFTTQLMSFLNERSPSLAVRKLSDFTEQYIELFTTLAVRYNINIIGGSHFVKEDDDNIYNIAYLFRRDGTIEKQYKIHITPNEKNGGGSTQVTACVSSIRIAGKLRYKFVMILSFRSLPESLPTWEPKSSSRHFVRKTGKVICAFAIVPRPVLSKIKFIPSFPERSAICRKRKIWISNMPNRVFSLHRISNLPVMA